MSTYSSLVAGGATLMWSNWRSSFGPVLWAAGPCRRGARPLLQSRGIICMIRQKWWPPPTSNNNGDELKGLLQSTWPHGIHLSFCAKWRKDESERHPQRPVQRLLPRRSCTTHRDSKKHLKYGTRYGVLNCQELFDSRPKKVVRGGWGKGRNGHVARKKGRRRPTTDQLSPYVSLSRKVNAYVRICLKLYDSARVLMDCSLGEIINEHRGAEKENQVAMVREEVEATIGYKKPKHMVHSGHDCKILLFNGRPTEFCITEAS